MLHKHITMAELNTVQHTFPVFLPVFVHLFLFFLWVFKVNWNSKLALNAAESSPSHPFVFLNQSTRSFVCRLLIGLEEGRCDPATISLSTVLTWFLPFYPKLCAASACSARLHVFILWTLVAFGAFVFCLFWRLFRRSIEPIGHRCRWFPWKCSFGLEQWQQLLAKLESNARITRTPWKQAFNQFILDTCVAIATCFSTRNIFLNICTQQYFLHCKSASIRLFKNK